MQYTITISGRNTVEGTYSETVSASQLNMVLTIDKTLDYGSFVVRNDRPEPYEVGDMVDIDITDGFATRSYHFIVSADDVTQLPNGYFIHAINIIELTKILEWQSDSTRTFTQRLTSDRLNLLEVVISLQSTLPLRPSSELETTRVFSIDTDLRPRLLAVEAPEFQFTNRNLKEMLFEVFDFIGAIPRLTKMSNQFVLTADFYNERGTQITEDAFRRMKRLNIAEYSTSLDADIKNLYDSYTTVIDPSPGKFKPLSSSEGLLTEDNAFLKTDYPIVEIVSLIAEIDGDEYDITDSIVEKEEWEQLQNIRVTDNLSKGRFRDNTLFFSRYSENISGFFDQIRLATGVNNRIDAVIFTAGLRDGTISFGDILNLRNDFRDIRFRLEYKSLLDSRTEVNRMDASNIKYDSQVYTGQPGNIIRADRALDRLFKLQQLMGNAEIMTSERVNALGNIMELGSFNSDGYIITTAEMICEKNHIQMKYMYSQNYQKVSEFVNVNSEIRLYDIPARTFRRNVYIENFVEVGIETKPNTSFVTPNGIRTFYNGFSNSQTTESNTPVGLFVFNNESAKGFNTTLNTLVKTQTAYAGGNALNFHAEFDNPKIAGFQLDNSDRSADADNEFDEINQSIEQDPTLLDSLFQGTTTLFKNFFTGTRNILSRLPFIEIRTPGRNVGINYSNDFGEIFECDFEFVQEATFSDANSVFLPVIAKTEIVNKLIDVPKHRILKDARENLAITYALHVLPITGLDDRIIIGKYLVERNNLLKSIVTANSQFEVFTSTKPYSITENLFSRSTDTASAITYSTNDYSVSGQVSGFTLSLSQLIPANTTWGIRKKDTKELVIVVNAGTGAIGQNNPPTSNPLVFTFRGQQSFVQYPNQSFTAPVFVLAPTSFQVLVAPQSTQIAVSWLDPNSPAADLYEIEITTNLRTWTTATTTSLSRTFTGLTPTTSYIFRVRAKIGTRFSEYTYLTAETTAPDPAQVQNLSLRLIGATDIYAEWDEVADAFGYFVFISTSATFSPLLPTGGLVRVNATNYVFNELNTPDIDPNTQYFVRVRALRGEVAGPLSDTVSITTLTLQPTAPPLITNLLISFNQITFTLVNTDDQLVTLFADTSTGATQRATGVRPNEARTFTVTAVNPDNSVVAKAQGTGKAMSTIVELPFAATEAPTAPSLAVGALTQTVNNHVKVDWSYTGPIVTNFVLERKPNAQLANDFGPIVTGIAANLRTQTDFFAPSSTLLEYRVRAVNQFDSVASNTRTITTGTFAPATPSSLSSNVVLDGLGNAAVTISWQRNSTDESGYYIYRDNVIAGTVTRGTLNFTDFVLENETFIYSVSAFNQNGISARSTGLTVNT